MQAWVTPLALITSSLKSMTAVVALLWLAAAPPAAAQSEPAVRAVEATPGVTGLPVPRFVSLKADRVNLRQGPGTEYPTAWVLSRAGMPVEVLKEFEAWRQIRDSDGTTGWVLGSMLSGRRTALVLPWEIKAGTPPPEVALKETNRENSRPVAMVEAGVIAGVRSCDRLWCHIVVGDLKGYVEQPKLWGVYPDETIR